MGAQSVAHLVADLAVIGIGVVLVRLSVLSSSASSSRRSRWSPPIVEDMVVRACDRRLGPGLAAPRGRGPLQPDRDLGSDHRRDRLLHAGHSRQHPRRAGAAVRQLAAARRLDPIRRRHRPGGRDPLALHGHRNAQPRDGVPPQRRSRSSKFAVLGSRNDRRAWCGAGYSSMSRIPPRPRVSRDARARHREAEIANVAKEPAPTCVLMDFVESDGRYACATGSPTPPSTTRPIRWCAACACRADARRHAAGRAHAGTWSRRRRIAADRAPAEEVRRRLDALANRALRRAHGRGARIVADALLRALPAAR